MIRSVRVNKKNNVYPCKPQFYYIKMVLRGSKLYRHVFVMKFIKPSLEDLKVYEHVYFYKDDAKWKGVSEHAQNVRIQTILRMRNVASKPLLSIFKFCSNQRVC